MPFPRDDLDDRNLLVSLAGSFWEGLFEQQDLAADIIRSRGRLERFVYDALEEVILASSRETIPLFHRRRWYHLVLRQSDMQRETTSAAGARYGQRNALVYGSAAVYGEAGSSTRASFPLPEGVAGATLLCNGICRPSRVLVRGLEFEIDAAARRLILASDPFADSQWEQQAVYSGDQIVDKQISAWLALAEIDEDLLWEHVAYPLGTRLPSTKNAKDFLNALWRAIIQGPSRRLLLAALSRAYDIPLVHDDAETVVEIDRRESERIVILTDKNAYAFRDSAVAMVSPNQRVYGGDPLVDGLQVFDLHRGEIPPPTVLSALLLGRDVLGWAYDYGIVARNADLPTAIYGDTEPRLRFELWGWPQDVARFWEDLERRAAAAGTSLASLFDTRPIKDGPVPKAILPKTLNPLRLIAENVLRWHAAIAVIKVEQIGQEALPQFAANLLRGIFVPHGAMIIVLVLPEGYSAASLASPGTTAALGADSTGYIAIAPPAYASTYDVPAMLAQRGTVGEPSNFCAA